MIYNDEHVDFILLGVTEADGGVRVVGLTGLTRGYMQQSRATADLGGLRELGMASHRHGEAAFTASYSGTHPVYARGETYGEAFAALGLDPVGEPAEEDE